MKAGGVLALALALAGCISFGAEPPDALLTLTPAQTREAGVAQTVPQGEGVAVLVPGIPAALATTRVPVQDGGAVAYVKEAQWVEAPNRLFQRLLSETLSARGRAVLPLRQTEFSPGTRIGGQLQAFGVDAATRTAIVTFDAALTRGGQLQTRRFEARVPVAEITAQPVGAALNQAANQVAAQVADWVG